MNRTSCSLALLLILGSVSACAADCAAHARELAHAGKTEEAAELYHHILATYADDFNTLFSCSNDLYYEQNFALADLFLARVQIINPSCAQAHFNRGIINSNLKNDACALSCFEQAVACNENYTRAHLWLAKTHHAQKNTEKALHHFKRVIELEPGNTDAHLEIARIYREKEQLFEACDHYEKVIAAKPHDPIILNELATLYISLGKTNQARALYETILANHPNNQHALYNIGYSYVTDGDLDTAISYYEKVLALNPDHPQAKFAIGHAYLRKGDMTNAWQKHAWFYKETGRISPSFATFMQENNFAHRRILLRPEGGLGDTLQFIRYGPQLKKMGAYVIASVQKPLHKLISRCPYLDMVLMTGDNVPPCDAHITLMSLPAAFNSTPETVPTDIPYLYPDPALVAQWHDYFANDTHFKIGICWQADVFNDSSRPLIARRGIPLEKLYCLQDFRDISLYSLQKHDGLEQLATLPATFPLHLLPDSFDIDAGPFMDTAAIMESLDLVITVDTALAHLAGALGKRVWLLLPYSVDWRWIVGRTDSPWYPSMRIFKQAKPFDWDSVVEQVYGALEELLAGNEHQ